MAKVRLSRGRPDLVVTVLFAVFFYKAAEMSHAPGGLWAALSVLVSLLTWLVLGWGLLLMVVGQVGLFVVITIVRILRDLLIAEAPRAPPRIRIDASRFGDPEAEGL